MSAYRAALDERLSQEGSCSPQALGDSTRQCCGVLGMLYRGLFSTVGLVFVLLVCNIGSLVAAIYASLPKFGHVSLHLPKIGFEFGNASLQHEKPEKVWTVADIDSNNSSATFRCHRYFHPWEALNTPHLSHYCVMMDDPKVYYMPVLGCALAPPQPYWLWTALTMFKGFAIYILMYSHIKENDKIKEGGMTDLYYCCHSFDALQFSLFKMKALFYFTLITFLVSAVSMVMTISGFTCPTLFQHYECWGVAMAMTPWFSNMMLLVYQIQAMMGAGASLKASGNMASTLTKLDHSVDVEVDNECPRSDRKYSLAYELLDAKAEGSYWVQDAIRWVVFLTLGPFLVTHVVLGATLQIGLLVGAGPFMFYLAITCGQQHKMDSEKALNFAVLTSIPVVIAFSCVLQYSASASTFWYTEMGWGASMWTALTERQSAIYFQELRRQILSSCPYLSEIMNEALP